MGQCGQGLECQAKESGFQTYVGHREPLEGGSVVCVERGWSLHFKLSLAQDGRWMIGVWDIPGASDGSFSCDWTSRVCVYMCVCAHACTCTRVCMHRGFPSLPLSSLPPTPPLTSSLENFGLAG